MRRIGLTDTSTGGSVGGPLVFSPIAQRIQGKRPGAEDREGEKH
jgi:hypothetical protein